MVAYARWQLGTDSMERVHRIIAANDERKQRKARAEAEQAERDGAAPGAGVLVHPTALR